MRKRETRCLTRDLDICEKGYDHGVSLGWVEGVKAKGRGFDGRMFLMSIDQLTELTHQTPTLRVNASIKGPIVSRGEEAGSTRLLSRK